jgi:hypothetical protein
MCQAFEAARLGFVGHEDAPLVSLHSGPSSESLCFVVFALGPPPELTPSNERLFSRFADAAGAAAAAIAAVIVEAKAPLNGVAAAMSDRDRKLLSELAKVLGTVARQEGFVEFRALGPNAHACQVGLSVGGTRAGLATIVATRDQQSLRCSIRNFQNEPFPGAPGFYPSVAHAISAHQEYFLKSARAVRRKTAPGWQRPFV